MKQLIIIALLFTASCSSTNIKTPTAGITANTCYNRISKNQIDPEYKKADRSGNCYRKDIGHYSLTKHFVGFDTLEDCKACGGK